MIIFHVVAVVDFSHAPTHTHIQKHTFILAAQLGFRFFFSCCCRCYFFLLLLDFTYFTSVKVNKRTFFHIEFFGHGILFTINIKQCLYSVYNVKRLCVLSGACCGVSYTTTQIICCYKCNIIICGVRDVEGAGG